ncbi:uncharacterized protein LOC129230178 [Uloborus diversus]|uniref:uncharacterized protein LOC129230178 n=1 Tax=Uloborus diversus TaxID=327109 RepID=UPI00240936D5|nr:uncharacterized protein LOC129230178 [Uloborus diversus]
MFKRNIEKLRKKPTISNQLKQIFLTVEELDNDITTVLTTTNPYFDESCVEYNYKERAYKPLDNKCSTVLFYSQIGTIIPKPPEVEKEESDADVVKVEELDTKRKNKFNFCDRATQTMTFLSKICSDTNDCSTGLSNKIPGNPATSAERHYPNHPTTGKHGSKISSPQQVQSVLSGPNFNFYDNPSDEFKDKGMGSLLALWKFSYPMMRGMSVTSLSWNNYYPDMFAAAFGTYDMSMRHQAGCICIYSLKCPSFPEKIISCKSGVICVEFNVGCPYLLVAGFADGAVAVYDIRRSNSTPIAINRNTKLEHIDIVIQVRWLPDNMDGQRNFCSISADSKVINWLLAKSELIPSEVINLRNSDPSTEVADSSDIVAGSCGTSISFHPAYNDMYLIGTESGLLHKCANLSTAQYLETYRDHGNVVYSVHWNPYHPRVFLSCSADWTIKIWDHSMNMKSLLGRNGPEHCSRVKVVEELKNEVKKDAIPNPKIFFREMIDCLAKNHNKSKSHIDVLLDKSIIETHIKEEQEKQYHMKVIRTLTDVAKTLGSQGSAFRDLKFENVQLNGNISKRNFKLPKIELKKFNGEAREFLNFWSQFKKIHEDKGIDNEDKMQYLIQSMEPGSKAERLVLSFPATGENYCKAIQQLKERFGRDDLLVQVYVRDLLRLVMKNAAAGRGKADLPSLYDELEGKLRMLETLGRTKEKYGDFLTPLVESCLPEEVLVTWERSRNLDLTEDKNCRSLEQLMNFLRQEVNAEEMVRLARTGFGTNSNLRKREPTTEKESDLATAAALLSTERKERIFRAMKKKEEEKRPKREKHIKRQEDPPPNLHHRLGEFPQTQCPRLLRQREEEEILESIFTFDLLNEVKDVTWAPFSSTLFAAVTNDSKVHIFDVQMNRQQPTSTYSIHRAKKNIILTSVQFNPIKPVIIVGDDKGSVISFKLSPNLRSSLKGGSNIMEIIRTKTDEDFFQNYNNI